MALTIKTKQAQDAQWFDYKQDGETVARFLIRPLDDTRYQVAQERTQIKTRTQGLDLDGIGENDKPWLFRDAEAVARYLLAGWEGLESPDGKPLPFSAGNAYQVFTQSQIGLVLWAWVKEQAEALQDKAFKDEDEAVKKP